jgi:hypothetical protein
LSICIAGRARGSSTHRRAAGGASDLEGEALECLTDLARARVWRHAQRAVVVRASTGPPARRAGSASARAPTPGEAPPCAAAPRRAAPQRVPQGAPARGAPTLPCSHGASGGALESSHKNGESDFTSDFTKRDEQNAPVLNPAKPGKPPAAAPPRRAHALAGPRPAPSSSDPWPGPRAPSAPPRGAAMQPLETNWVGRMRLSSLDLMDLMDLMDQRRGAARRGAARLPGRRARSGRMRSATSAGRSTPAAPRAPPAAPPPASASGAQGASGFGRRRLRFRAQALEDPGCGLSG